MEFRPEPAPFPEARQVLRSAPSSSGLGSYLANLAGPTSTSAFTIVAPSASLVASLEPAWSGLSTSPSPHRQEPSRPREYVVGSYSKLVQVAQDIAKDLRAARPSAVSSGEQPAGYQGALVRPTLPLASMIRSLIEQQHLNTARRLLASLPLDPEYATLRRLLGTPRTWATARRDRNRSQEFDWLRTNAKDYVGRWVALDGVRLIAAADSLANLRQQLRRAEATAGPPLVHFIEQPQCQC